MPFAYSPLSFSRLTARGWVLVLFDASLKLKLGIRMSFYRCCHTLSNGSLVTFPEFGTAKGLGCVDFYIPARHWGTKLLLGDGDQLEKTHSNSRFADPQDHLQCSLYPITLLWTAELHIQRKNILVGGVTIGYNCPADMTCTMPCLRTTLSKFVF